MNILWTSLVEFPPLCRILGKDIPSHCGWMYSLAKALLKNISGTKLGVMVLSTGSKYAKYEVEGITYYIIPTRSIYNTDNNQIEKCKLAIEDFKPTIIHIHGTEHSLAKAVCVANDNQVKTVANIQGLASQIYRYADGGLSLWDKLINITPLDFYRGTFLLNVKKKFKARGKNERYVLNNITDVIGRTQWDYDHVMTLNPNLEYHFMNETLRDSFYKDPVWNFKSCDKRTIFVSNSSEPLKGAHQVLKALPIVLQKYPDIMVRFCGSSVMSNDMKQLIRFQGYYLYLRRLVKKIGIEDHVEFLGTLTEEEMKAEFLKANVYVMPSSIENSPNSLCEAQILGVPIVASYCGGVPTLITEGKTGFMYRYEETEMLAHTIMRVLEMRNFDELHNEEIKVARERHDRDENSKILLDIYTKMLNR